MTIIKLAFLMSVGRLLIWFLQTAGPVRHFREHTFTRELFSCDFCLGVWVFSGLSLALMDKQPIFGMWNRYLEAGLFGIVASFFCHLIRIGWSAKFDIMVYE